MSKRVIKIATIISLVFIIISIFYVWNSPSTGYESSIYKATSPLFWAALAVSLICGVAIITHQVYTKRHDKSRLWQLGLLLIYIDYIAVLSLWIIRGYAMWCPFDPNQHLGIIQEVLSNGHVSSSNCYPITHIYIAQISSLTGISPIFPYKLIPLMFGILFVPFIYLFARLLLKEKGQVIFATIASMALAHEWYLNLTPNHLSNLLFPLAIYLLMMSWFSKRVSWKILIIIIVFLFAPFHPVPSLALLLIALSIWLWQKRFVKSSQKTIQLRRSLISKFNVTLIVLMTIWIIAWISSFGIWDSTIQNIHKIITEGSTSQLDMLKNQIDYAQGLGYSVFGEFLKVYTGAAVCILCALIAFPFLYKKLRSEPELGNLFSMYIPIAAYAFSIVLLYFFNLWFGPLRLLVYIVIICTPFVGFLLYEVVKRYWSLNKRSPLRIASIVLPTIILIGMPIIGAMKLYPSSYIYEPNWQITRTEISGMDWFLHNKDINMNITSLSISPGGFAFFLLAPQQIYERQDLHQLQEGLYVPDELQMPYHFGYNDNLSVGESYTDEIYLVLNQYDRVLYSEVYPDMAELRFLPEDFKKLEQDSRVNKLYSNGGFDTYVIQGLASPF